MRCGLFFWLALRLVLAAIVVLYFVLVLARPRKGRSADWLFWVIVALVWMRIAVPFVLGYGLAYRVSVVCLGIAAAVGVHDRIYDWASPPVADARKDLIADKANDVQ
jgi:uncharacterized membrane protein